ncbi:MAG: hypothetical protein IIA61_02155 [Candidatus Marinimicrobia bacterium]|nr:hypothetical protein [Candidatus Neomarinimicrobiota bacterium]
MKIGGACLVRSEVTVLGEMKDRRWEKAYPPMSFRQAGQAFVNRQSSFTGTCCDS